MTQKWENMSHSDLIYLKLGGSFLLEVVLWKCILICNGIIIIYDKLNIIIIMSQPT